MTLFLMILGIFIAACVVIAWSACALTASAERSVDSVEEKPASLAARGFKVLEPSGSGFILHTGPSSKG
jgi:hypothetical protein